MTSLSFSNGNIVYSAGGFTTTIVPTATSNCTVSLPNGTGTLIYGPVSLSTQVTGTLLSTNGGTGTTTSPSSGQILVGTSGGQYIPYTLASGTGISTTAGSGTLQINNTGVTSFSGDGTGLTPSTPTTGAVVLGGILGSTYGGTGVNNGSFTVTLGGNITTAGAFTTSGANPLTLTTTGSTNVTLPTSGTLLTAGGAVTTFQTSLSGLTPSSATSGAITLAGTLGSASGGTGVNNGSFTITLGDNITTAAAFTTSGAFPLTLTTTGSTNVTLPTSGTLLTSATAVTSLAGTANQVTVSASTGAVTISIPSTFIAPGSITSTSTITSGTTLTVGTLFYNGMFSFGAGGTTQGTATPVPRTNAYVSTSTAGSGIILPTPAYGGLEINVFNRSTNAINVYPNSGAVIDYYPPDTPVVIPSLGSAKYIALASNQWYTQEPVLVAGAGISVTYPNAVSGQTTIANTGVTSFSAGATGFTPSSSTTGAVTLNGTLVVGHGGTGQTTFTTGSILLGNGTSALSSLADVATGSALTSGGLSTNPAWTAFTSSATVSTIASRDVYANSAFNNVLQGYTTTVTAGSSTSLSAASTNQQYFTGTSFQTCILPAVASSITLGENFSVTNNSTGIITVTSSGGQVVSFVQPGVTSVATCTSLTGTTAASWGNGNVGTYTASNPSSLCFDGTYVWVANKGANNVLQINATTGVTTGTFTVGTAPQGICYDSGSGTIWVTNFTSGTVSALLASNGATVGTYTVGTNPYGICSDGTYIWVANYGAGTVSKVLIATGVTVGTYTVGTNPTDICWDGANIWVANYGGGTGNTVTKLFATTGALVGTYTVGTAPYGICSDGTYIWVASFSSSNVTKLLASTGTTIGAYSVGGSAFDVCFDGTSIWVCTSAGSVVKLSVTTGVILGTYPLSSTAYTESICFDGANIWAANYSDSTVCKLTQLGIPTAPIGVPLLSASDYIGRDVNANTYINNVVEGIEEYVSSNGTYAVGTASQSTTAISGIGTNWTSAMNNGTVVYANNAIAVITAVNSATSLTASTSQTESAQAYVLYYGTLYNAGTVSQSTNIITGSGTAFTPAMIGGWFVFSTGAVALITGFLSTTSLTADRSQTVGSANYRMYYTAIQMSVLSGYQLYFNGTSNQYVDLPPVATMASGQSYSITNNGTGVVTILGAEIGTPTTYALPSNANVIFTCISNTSLTYAVGTASQTTTAVAGIGTNWTSAMNGGTLVYANKAIAPITAFVSGTSITSSTSQTETAQSYVLYYGTKYATGTVGQSGTVLTGSSTVFTAAMVGGWVIYTSGASAGTVAQVTAFTSTTSLTVTPSQSVTAGASYVLYYLVVPGSANNASWSYASSTSLSYYDISATVSTAGYTGTSYAVVTGMTVTPAAGTYMVRFDGSLNFVTTVLTTMSIQLFFNAVAVAESLRSFATSITSSFQTCSTQAIVVCDGIHALNLQWIVVSGSGTVTMGARNLIILRVA